MADNFVPSVDFAAYIPLHKKKRIEAKKRKIKAFLSLVSKQDKDFCVPVKKVKYEYERYRRKSSEIRSPSEVLETEEISDSNPSGTSGNLEQCGDYRTSDSVKVLRRNMKEIIKQNEPAPYFYLTDFGLAAQLTLSGNDKLKNTDNSVVPIFAEDIQHLLLRALVNKDANCKTRWCKLVRPQNLSHILLLVVEGLSKNRVIKNVEFFKNTKKLFCDIVEVISSKSYSLSFPVELCGLHVRLGHQFHTQERKFELGDCNTHKALSSIFPIENDQHDNVKSKKSQGLSKLHLLLSPVQMLMEGYPLPQNVFENAKCNGYCFTKNTYTPALEISPMYALDCEMCLTFSGRMEVARISIVDEKLQLVYDTLVKPQEKVINYLTKYSGVTKEMLGSVTTTLEDVQKKLQSILPSNAILCGQSLNCDLHSLKMIHPYVIDTSVIYNVSGCRTRKVALKMLSRIFLNEDIQIGDQGHSPIEDSIATMKLVLLKLKNGPQFGDVILGGNIPSVEDSLLNSVKREEVKKCSNVDIHETNNSQECNLPLHRNNNLYKRRFDEDNISSKFQSSYENKHKLDVDKFSNSFFTKLQDKMKNVCIIGNQNAHDQYSKEMLTSNIVTLIQPNNKKVIRHTIKEMLNHDLTISHIKVSSSNLSSKLYTAIDDFISELYNVCASKSMFIVLGTGSEEKNENGVYENGLCMMKIKETAR